jgi:hypothetical protein
MRLNRLLPGSLMVIMALAAPAAAQEWTEYQNNGDGFKVNFPGEPKVMETTWKSEFEYTLPARIYSVDKGREHYAVTVVDYSGIEEQGIARRKACPAGAEPCIGSDLSGPGYWKHDVRGALIFATAKLLQRDVKLTHYLWNHQDLVEGHELQLVNNTDQSLTFAYIAMHEMKLYIAEGTVPKGYPVPALFQGSMGWVDKDGNSIRYQTIYANQFYGLKELPPPARAGRGGRGGGAGGQGQGGGRRGGGPGAGQQP